MSADKWEAVTVGTTTDKHGNARDIAEIFNRLGECIADSMYREDAERIVRAVNAHDELLAALTAIANMPVESNEWDAVEMYDDVKALASAVIAKATA